jgi:hypothetical protein
LVEVHKNDVLQSIERVAGSLGRRMAEASRAEVAEYAAVRDESFAAEVLAHAEEHVHTFVRSARRGRPPAGAELDFVSERGARRARELLSLDALLEAYLVGQRTVWEAVVAAAGPSPGGLRAAQELTAETFRYTHAINLAVSAAYVRESEALASERERSRRDLLDRLLAGDSNPAGAEALGLRPGGAHFVVVATADGTDERLAVRLAGQALAFDGRGSFVVERGGELIAVVPVYVRRGPREVGAALARAVRRLARTHEIELRAGLSNACARLDEVARGYAEATRALRQAAADGEPVVAIGDVPLLDLLAAGADATTRELAPADTLPGALAETVRAYAAADLNVARAAEALSVHPNTVHYRLKRVEAITGRDPRRFGQLVELLLAERLRPGA